MAGKANPPKVASDGPDEETPSRVEVPVNTLNEWAISAGQNMENHTESIAGRRHFVRQMNREVPTFRTKQAAFRYAAYLVTLAENVKTASGVGLPDEEGAHTYEEVLHAIQNA